MFFGVTFALSSFLLLTSSCRDFSSPDSCPTFLEATPTFPCRRVLSMFMSDSSVAEITKCMKVIPLVFLTPLSLTVLEVELLQCCELVEE